MQSEKKVLSKNDGHHHKAFLCILKQVYLGLALYVASWTSCASSTGIFPPVPTATETSLVVLPDPISIAADPANNQIVVVNSNVDFEFANGSLSTISVDASSPTSPILSATTIVPTFNYGGQIAYDGAFAYVPFREGGDPDSNKDRIVQFAIGPGSIASSAEAETGDEPFGVTLGGGLLLIVSDKVLNVFDAAFTAVATIDLTQVQGKGITDVDSRFVETVAYDTVNNRAFVTNRLGKVLVVDLNSFIVSHVIDGPNNSRGIAFDGVHMYIVDGNPPALWIMDPSAIPAATSPPEEVDDAQLLIDVINLASNPNGIAIDAANRRAYVANSGGRSVSVIDLNLLEELDRISLKKEDTGLTEAVEPFGIAVGTFNGVPLVFVANVGSDTISVINGNTLKVVASFPK